MHCPAVSEKWSWCLPWSSLHSFIMSESQAAAAKAGGGGSVPCPRASALASRLLSEGPLCVRPFSTRGHGAPRGCLAESRDSFGCHSWDAE